LTQALVAFDFLGIRRQELDCLSAFADLLYRLGDLRTAAQIAAAVAQSRQTSGIQLAPRYSRSHEEWLSALRGTLDESVFSDCWQQGREMDFKETVKLALAATKK
jgi:hypothetical protein